MSLIQQIVKEKLLLFSVDKLLSNTSCTQKIHHLWISWAASHVKLKTFNLTSVTSLLPISLNPSLDRIGITRGGRLVWIFLHFRNVIQHKMKGLPVFSMLENVCWIYQNLKVNKRKIQPVAVPAVLQLFWHFLWKPCSDWQGKPVPLVSLDEALQGSRVIAALKQSDQEKGKQF